MICLFVCSSLLRIISYLIFSFFYTHDKIHVFLVIFFCILMGILSFRLLGLGSYSSEGDCLILSAWVRQLHYNTDRCGPENLRPGPFSIRRKKDRRETTSLSLQDIIDSNAKNTLYLKYCHSLH